jgi:Fur family ferric uptake transcriptional regulator
MELIETETTAVAHADLFARLEGRLDRTTVFRTLTTLTRSGLIRRVELGDRVWRYRREATPGAPTASFLCVTCQRVTDLPSVKIVMPAPLRAIARREIDVTVRGVCDRCDGGDA